MSFEENSINQPSHRYLERELLFRIIKSIRIFRNDNKCIGRVKSRSWTFLVFLNIYDSFIFWTF